MPNDHLPVRSGVDLILLELITYKLQLNRLEGETGPA